MRYVSNFFFYENNTSSSALPRIMAAEGEGPVKLRQEAGPPATARKWRAAAFTLIELLIVIAIIAVLALVVVLAINPAELLKQSRDSVRLSDVSSLQTALNLYVSDTSVNGNTLLGSSSVVYVSIPDPLATSTLGNQCQGIGLPSLPALFSYHCSASSTLRLNDGSGWMPVNFKAMSSGAPFGSLPTDPINASSSRSYYTYTANGGQYEVTANLESAKYRLGGSNDAIAGDGGTKASLYEKGTDLSLEPLDYGDPSLVGLWTFDEGVGTVAYDYSGSNATGSWVGTQAGTNGYYSSGKMGMLWAGAFDGGTNRIIVANYPSITPSAISIAAWVNPSGGNGHSAVITTGNILFTVATSGLEFWPDTSNYGPTFNVAMSGWMFVAAVYDYDAETGALYVNGSRQAIASPQPVKHKWNKEEFGDYALLLPYYTGLIDNVRIYNRALSSAEIQALYSGGK
jgi:prepilin-type N-terminal cleavage/methylation domain-containing protein